MATKIIKLALSIASLVSGASKSIPIAATRHKLVVLWRQQALKDRESIPEEPTLKLRSYSILLV